MRTLNPNGRHRSMVEPRRDRPGPQFFHVQAAAAAGPFRSRSARAPVPRIGPARSVAAAIIHEDVAIGVLCWATRGRCIAACVTCSDKSHGCSDRYVGGRSGDVNRLRRCRGPSRRSCLWDCAVGGAAFGSGEVGCGVGAAAAAEAVCPDPPVRPVAQRTAARCVTRPRVDTFCAGQRPTCLDVEVVTTVPR